MSQIQLCPTIATAPQTLSHDCFVSTKAPEAFPPPIPYPTGHPALHRVIFVKERWIVLSSSLTTFSEDS